METEYRTGLCDCHKDPKLCIMSWCWPQVVMGLTDFKLDKTKKEAIAITYAMDCCFPCMCTGLGWFGLGTIMIGTAKRAKIRHTYGIEGDSCKDRCTLCFCTCCAVAQDAREVKMRGEGRLGAVAPLGKDGGVQEEPFTAQRLEPGEPAPGQEAASWEAGPAPAATPPPIATPTPAPPPPPVVMAPPESPDPAKLKQVD
eukprot:tig00020614_g12162.t1